MEYMDGAVVSGNCVTASCKTMTYDHCNNPAILELMKRHGKDLEFVGVITSPITASLGDKNRGVIYPFGMLISLMLLLKTYAFITAHFIFVNLLICQHILRSN